MTDKCYKRFGQQKLIREISLPFPVNANQATTRTAETTTTWLNNCKKY